MIILGEQVSMALGFVSLILAKVRKCLGFKNSSEHELVAGNTDVERTSNELAESNNLTEKIIGKILGLTDEADIYKSLRKEFELEKENVLSSRYLQSPHTRQ